MGFEPGKQVGFATIATLNQQYPVVWDRGCDVFHDHIHLMVACEQNHYAAGVFVGPVHELGDFLRPCISIRCFQIDLPDI